MTTSSATTDYLHGYDPTDTADTYGGRSIVRYDYNIGSVVKVSAKTFDSGDTTLQVTSKVTEGPNKDNLASIRFPAAPNLNEQVGGGWVPISDPAKIAARVKEWQRALAAFLTAFKLPTPTAEQLANDMLATEYLAAAEGKQVVFGMYEDKNGYGAIPCFPSKDTGKWHVGVRAADSAARNRKGDVIPGMDAAMQARQEIAKYEAKQQVKG